MLILSEYTVTMLIRVGFFFSLVTMRETEADSRYIQLRVFLYITYEGLGTRP